MPLLWWSEKSFFQKCVFIGLLFTAIFTSICSCISLYIRKETSEKSQLPLNVSVQNLSRIQREVLSSLDTELDDFSVVNKIVNVPVNIAGIEENLIQEMVPSNDAVMSDEVVDMSTTLMPDDHLISTVLYMLNERIILNSTMTYGKTEMQTEETTMFSLMTEPPKKVERIANLLDAAKAFHINEEMIKSSTDFINKLGNSLPISSSIHGHNLGGLRNSMFNTHNSKTFDSANSMNSILKKNFVGYPAFYGLWYPKRYPDRRVRSVGKFNKQLNTHLSSMKKNVISGGDDTTKPSGNSSMPQSTPSMLSTINSPTSSISDKSTVSSVSTAMSSMMTSMMTSADNATISTKSTGMEMPSTSTTDIGMPSTSTMSSNGSTSFVTSSDMTVSSMKPTTMVPKTMIPTTIMPTFTSKISHRTEDTDGFLDVDITDADFDCLCNVDCDSMDSSCESVCRLRGNVCDRNVLNVHGTLDTGKENTILRETSDQISRKPSKLSKARKLDRLKQLKKMSKFDFNPLNGFALKKKILRNPLLNDETIDQADDLLAIQRLVDSFNGIDNSKTGSHFIPAKEFFSTAFATLNKLGFSFDHTLNTEDQHIAKIQ